MRKRKKGRKITEHKRTKKALLNGLAASLFLHERIRTTEAKAKELSPFAQKCITRAKKADLGSIRYLAGIFPKKIASKLLKDLGPRYKDRKGGYVRIIKLGPRKSDGAKMAIIELV